MNLVCEGTICALIVLGLSGLAAQAEAACSGKPGKLRYDDDTECFRDPQMREGFPGIFKFVPLDESGGAFVSLGGEVRQRYEYTHDPLFGADPQDEKGVWLQRYMLHADLQAGPRLRFFGQLSSALEAGREGGPSPVGKNELALQNAFVDFSFAPVPDADVTLRAGRQELQYGSGRLVDVREGPNVRRTFDAGRAILELPHWRMDGLVGRVPPSRASSTMHPMTIRPSGVFTPAATAIRPTLIWVPSTLCSHVGTTSRKRRFWGRATSSIYTPSSRSIQPMDGR